MNELLPILKWALPPVLGALVIALGIVWRRLVQEQDGHDRTIRDLYDQEAEKRKALYVRHETHHLEQQKELRDMVKEYHDLLQEVHKALISINHAIASRRE